MSEALLQKLLLLYPHTHWSPQCMLALLGMLEAEVGDWPLVSSTCMCVSMCVCVSVCVCVCVCVCVRALVLLSFTAAVLLWVGCWEQRRAACRC